MFQSLHENCLAKCLVHTETSVIFSRGAEDELSQIILVFLSDLPDSRACNFYMRSWSCSLLYQQVINDGPRLLVPSQTLCQAVILNVCVQRRCQVKNVLRSTANKKTTALDTTGDSVSARNKPLFITLRFFHERKAAIQYSVFNC